MTYTPEGLVEDVFADSAHTQLKTKFYYNASGQRVRKEWYQYNSGTGTNELLRETRYYRVSGGMPYEVETTEYSGGSPTGTDNEYLVYGAGRLGTYQRDQNAWNYELADHLGNVRAVFTPERVTQFATGFEGTGTHDHLYQGGIVSTDEQRTGTNSVVVNGNNGPKLSLEVDAGDQLDFELYYLLSGANSTPIIRVRLYTESGDLAGTSAQLGSPTLPVGVWHTMSYTMSVTGTGPYRAEIDVLTSTSSGTPDPIYFDDWSVDVTTSGNSGIKDVSLISLADYYPFGEVMPGRSANNTAYRYTFQGQERDAELNWNGFELRTFDGRLGRWNNRDPYRQHWSPFVAMGNNPISRIDPDGGRDYYIDGMVVSERMMNAFMNGNDGNIDVSHGGLEAGTTLGFEYDGKQYYGDEANERAGEAKVENVQKYLADHGISLWDGALFSYENTAYSNKDGTITGGAATMNYLGEFSDVAYLFGSDGEGGFIIDRVAADFHESSLEYREDPFEKTATTLAPFTTLAVAEPTFFGEIILGATAVGVFTYYALQNPFPKPWYTDRPRDYVPNQPNFPSGPEGGGKDDWLKWLIRGGGFAGGTAYLKYKYDQAHKHRLSPVLSAPSDKTIVKPPVIRPYNGN